MSVLAVSDLVFGDLLTELNLKPWWEKIRGYFFAASVVCALFMTYSMLSSTSINCFPIVARNTTQTAISTTEAHFINNYCFNQLPLYISLFGFSPLCFSILIMLASSWWTMFPDVINSFRTFSQFEEIIGNLNLTSEQLCDLLTKIVDSSSSDECKQLRKACFLLWKYKSRINVEKYYWIRNQILMFATTIIFASSVIMLYFMFVDKSNFKCFLKLDDEFNETIKVTKQQLCSHNKIKNLEPFMFPFTISLFAQGAFTAVGISKFWSYPRTLWKVHDNSGRKVSQRSSSSNCIKPEAQYSFFIIKFWKNSKPTSNGALQQIVKHMFDKGISNMKPNLEKAISEDVEMFKLYCCYAIEKHAFWTIDKEIKKESFTVGSILHANIVQCIKHLKPGLNRWEFRAFIDYLCEKKFWELLANVSVQCLRNWVRDRNAPLSLEINPNEIGQPYNSGRSFLYYLDKVASQDAVETVLTTNLIGEYVHFDGKSVEMDNFSLSKLPNYCLRHLLVDGSLTDNARNAGTRTYDPDKAGTLTLTKGESSKELIRKLCKDHEKTTNNFKEKFNNSDTQTKEEIRSKYKEYLENLSEELSRYKFGKWDDITNLDDTGLDLAKFANDEKQWVLLVALLNAYIVIYGSTKTVHPILIKCCTVNEFTLINSEETENISPNESILYYALTKPPYLKNFLFTAVRHILGCTQGQEKNVRKDDGTVVSAMDFVKKNQNLEFEERERLVQLLGNANEEPSSIDETSQSYSLAALAAISQGPTVTFQTSTATSIAETSQTPAETTIIQLRQPDENDPLLPRQTSPA